MKTDLKYNIGDLVILTKKFSFSFFIVENRKYKIITVERGGILLYLGSSYIKKEKVDDEVIDVKICFWLYKNKKIISTCKHFVDNISSSVVLLMGGFNNNG